MTTDIAQALYAEDLNKGLYKPFNHPIAARRIVGLVATLLLLLAVCSCKATPATNTTANAVNPARELQAFLFPAKAGVSAVNYVSRARNFVESLPQSMLLLSRDQIGYMYGKPSFHRHDADAEVWQYKTASCVVDFYFYDKSQVSYIEARRKNQTAVNAGEVSSCLHGIERKDFAAAGI